MATGEKRLPREAFTKKLRRLCERLDERHQRTISFRHFFFRHEQLTADVEIQSIWVAGSYARGALDCGDLDIVIQPGQKNNLPPTSTLTRAFFGPLPYVRYYVGDPAKNTSGVEFPDAVQIWSGPGCDWGAAIDSIKPDSSAGRAKRDLDVIPLRAEQLYGSDDEPLLELIQMHADGLIDWEFIELERAALEPIPEAELTESEERLLRLVYRWGRKSKQLLPALIRLMREREPLGVWDQDFGEVSTIYCGGTQIRVGRPYPSIHGLFDGGLEFHRLALVPHMSARGPNGIWLIRRGPKHPDLAAFAGRHAYYLADEGDPSLVTCGSDYGNVDLIELFTSEKRAQKEARFWNKEGVPVEVARATGTDLLHFLGLCDVVSIDQEHYGVNWTGRRYCEKETVSKAEEIAAALPPTS